MKRDNAFTGLEAAIVLIAFVVVAAVFSYVMLGAGFFATQKAQEVTYASIKQSTSNVVFEGMMYANATAAGELTGFTFSIKVPGGGQPVDMSNAQFVYTSTYVIPPVSLVDNNGPESAKAGAYPSMDVDILYPTGNGDLAVRTGTEHGCEAYDGTLGPIYQAYFPQLYINGVMGTAGVGDSVLMPGQSAFYTVCVGPDTEYLGSGDWFSLELIPQIGASTLLTKRIDAGLQNGKPLL